MDDLFKICAIAVTAVMLALVIKRDTPYIALAVAIAAVTVILSVLLSFAETILDFLNGLAAAASISEEIIEPLLKMVGISIICRIVSDICRDGAHSSLATAVDIGGTCIGFYIALPILTQALEMLTSLL